MRELMLQYLKYKSHIIYFFTIVFTLIMMVALIARENKCYDITFISKPFSTIVFETGNTVPYMDE